MIRPLITRIVLVATTVALGLGLTLWLDGNRSRALTVLPSGSTLGADQALVYALRPSSENEARDPFIIGQVLTKASTLRREQANSGR